MLSNYTPELISYFTVILLSPIIPLFHIILCKKFKRMIIVTYTMIATLPYIIIWLVVLFTIKSHYFLNNTDFIYLTIGGLSGIGSIMLSYMELIAQPFRGFTLDLLVNIYFNNSSIESLQQKNINNISNKLLNDRIKIMEKYNFIHVNGDNYILSIHGNIVGKITIIVKNILKIPI